MCCVQLMLRAHQTSSGVSRDAASQHDTNATDKINVAIIQTNETAVSSLLLLTVYICIPIVNACLFKFSGYSHVFYPILVAESFNERQAPLLFQLPFSITTTTTTTTTRTTTTTTTTTNATTILLLRFLFNWPIIPEIAPD